MKAADLIMTTSDVEYRLVCKHMLPDAILSILLIHERLFADIIVKLLNFVSTYIQIYLLQYNLSGAVLDVVQVNGVV